MLVTAEGRVTIKPFGLVGHQLLGGGWSKKERISLVQDPSNVGGTVLTQQFPRLVDPGPVLARFLERFFPGLLVPTQPLNQVGYTWSVFYNFDQYLWSPAGVPDRGIGVVFFRFGPPTAWRTPSNTPTTSGSVPRGSGPGGRVTTSGSAGRARC